MLQRFLDQKEGSEFLLLQAIHETAQETWKEPGVFKYVISNVDGETGTLMLIEGFVSREAFASHQSSAHVLVLKQKIADLIREPVLVLRGMPLFCEENMKVRSSKWVHNSI